MGSGPLEPLLRDDAVTDILVNGHDQVFVEKFGKLQPTGVTFQDDQHLMLIIGRIVAQVGRRVDEASPMVDARLRDGSRINAIIPPLALNGPALSIRRFGRHRFDIEGLVTKGTLTREVLTFLEATVKARLNILVCGGTGSGKTTMLNCLSACIPADERIVDDRGFGGIIFATAARSPSGNASHQSGRQRRDYRSRPREKLITNAA